MRDAIAFFIGIALSLGLAYLLAMIGEPQAVWLWCDLLSACPQ